MSIIKSIPIFSNLSDEIINNIIKYGSTRTYQMNEIILLEGEVNTDFYIILSGRVKVSNISPDQKEYILTFINEGDHFGEISLMDGYPSTANIIAAGECRIFKIHSNEFYDLLNKYPDIPINMLKTVNERIREADAKIKTLTISTAEEKVASMLIDLAEKYGKEINGSVKIRNFPLQRTMANMAGVARETISRQMHQFMEKNMIKIDNKTIRIPDYNNFKKMYR